jgi:hypothetical protein
MTSQVRKFVKRVKLESTRIVRKNVERKDEDGKEEGRKDRMSMVKKSV